jgi:hypothetical protein
MPRRHRGSSNVVAKVVVSPKVCWDQIVARGCYRQIQDPSFPFDSTVKDLNDKSPTATQNCAVALSAKSMIILYPGRSRDSKVKKMN